MEVVRLCCNQVVIVLMMWLYHFAARNLTHWSLRPYRVLRTTNVKGRIGTFRNCHQPVPDSKRVCVSWTCTIACASGDFDTGLGSTAVKGWEYLIRFIRHAKPYSRKASFDHIPQAACFFALNAGHAACINIIACYIQASVKVRLAVGAVTCCAEF